MSLHLGSELKCGLFIKSLLPGRLRLTHQLPVSSPAPLGMIIFKGLSLSLCTEQHFKGENYLVDLETWFLLYQITRHFFTWPQMTLELHRRMCSHSQHSYSAQQELPLISPPCSCPSLWCRMESRVLGWPPELLSLKQWAPLVECYHLFHSSPWKERLHFQSTLCTVVFTPLPTRGV